MRSFSPDDAWGFTFFDRWRCRKKVEALNYGAIYTPPSLQGTIFSPSVGGGPNWGGGAYDPDSHIMVVPSNRVPTIVKLIPRAEAVVTAVDLVTREIVWEVPLGSIEKMLPFSPPWDMDFNYGTPGAGGLYATTMGDSVVAYKLKR